MHEEALDNGGIVLLKVEHLAEQANLADEGKAILLVPEKRHRGDNVSVFEMQSIWIIDCNFSI